MIQTASKTTQKLSLSSFKNQNNRVWLIKHSKVAFELEIMNEAQQMRQLIALGIICKSKIFGTGTYQTII